MNLPTALHIETLAIVAAATQGCSGTTAPTRTKVQRVGSVSDQIKVAGVMLQLLLLYHPYLDLHMQPTEAGKEVGLSINNRNSEYKI